MKYLLKAITTNNRDLKTSILFSIEENSYLFNCPDGFQRIALSSKMSFKKVRYVFISQMQPDYFGGFPGFYLSSRESQGVDLKNFKMGVYGPEGLREALYASTAFMGSLNHIEFDEFHKPRSFNPLQSKSNVQVFGTTPGNMIFKDNLLTIQTVGLQSHDQREKDCYSFIGMPIQAKGKFLPLKAKQLGCNPQVHYKLLNDGLQVTLPDGSIVYPFQVVEDPLPSQCFMLIFMPNENYLESLFSESITKQFQPFFQNNIDPKTQKVSIIYHSVPLNCVLNEHYKEFMRRFGPNVKHVLDCHECNDEVIGRTRGYTLSQRHKIVCPSLIPLSKVALQHFEKDNAEMIKQQFQDIDYVHSKLGLVYDMYPAQQQGFNHTQVIKNSDIFNESEDGIRSEMQLLINGLIELKKSNDSSFSYKQMLEEYKGKVSEPEILFLGTVSMKPTMYRSASAIMVFVNGFGLLMDCAEGSYGQLWDHYQTKEKVDKVLATMRVIFITHIHGDHQLGVIKIMLERDKLIEKYDENNKLYIVTPAPMMEWMEIFKNETLRYPEMVELVPNSVLNPEPIKYYRENENQDRYTENDSGGEEDKEEEKKQSPKTEKLQNVVCKEKSLDDINQIVDHFQTEHEQAREMLNVLSKTMGITQILAIETDHCVESYACLINSPVFGRILYSGDTSPCQNLMNYAQNVTLLIHEATFEDGLEKDAFHKKHTTTGQVMAIAEKCKPWRTVLTHFSPRYQKIAEITDNHLATKTMVSFDHMRIKISQFEWAYHLLDIYRKVFTNDDPSTEGQAKVAYNKGAKKMKM